MKLADREGLAGVDAALVEMLDRAGLRRPGAETAGAGTSSAAAGVGQATPPPTGEAAEGQAGQSAAEGVPRT